MDDARARAARAPAPTCASIASSTLGAIDPGAQQLGEIVPRSRSIARNGTAAWSSLASSTRTTCGESSLRAAWTSRRNRSTAASSASELRRSSLTAAVSPVPTCARLVDLAHAAAADHVAEPELAET